MRTNRWDFSRAFCFDPIGCGDPECFVATEFGANVEQRLHLRGVFTQITLDVAGVPDVPELTLSPATTPEQRTGTGHVIGATYRNRYWGGTYKVIGHAYNGSGVEVECITPGAGAHQTPGERWMHLTSVDSHPADERLDQPSRAPGTPVRPTLDRIRDDLARIRAEQDQIEMQMRDEGGLGLSDPRFLRLHALWDEERALEDKLDGEIEC